MPPTNGRWWLTQDSSETVIDATPEAHLRPGGRPAPHGRVEPRVPDASSGPTARRARPWAPRSSATTGAALRAHRWSRQGRVLAADPGREFAFVTEEGGRESTEWRYRFEPVEGGTRVTESYDVQVDPDLGPDRRRPDQPAPRAARGHAPHARAAQDRRRGQERSRPAMSFGRRPG